MSNPTGTDPEDGAETAEQPDYQPAADSDPVTEVIEVVEVSSDDASSAPATGERRYTAPGFDAGSTQIIDRLPDDETEFIATAPASNDAAAAPRTAVPQAIAPRKPGRPGWLIPMLVVLAVLLAGVITGVVLLQRSNAAKAQEDMVRSSIQTFDAAVQNGDLATLRSITCGQTRENYAKYDDETWAEAATRILAAKQYPVVASIDEVVVDGDHAEANVTSYMAYDPGTTSVRSFDLQFRDDQWKICQAS